METVAGDNDATEAVSSHSAMTSEPVAPECAIDMAALLGAGFGTVDFSPSESLDDLADRSVAIVSGRLESTELVVQDRVEGVRLVVDGTTWWNDGTDGRPISDLWIPALDSEPVPVLADDRLQISVVAFVEREIPGIDAAAVWPEGLWAVCDTEPFGRGEEPAAPVMIEPSAPGWQPLLADGVTLDELIAPTESP